MGRSIHIGEVICNAIVFDFKNARKGVMSPDNLLKTVADLFTVLHERRIKYLLVGGGALLQYVEGRNTEDIDLIMALSSLRQLPELQITHQDRDFARGTFGELRINVLLTRNPLFSKVQRKYATVQPFVEQEIACATVEGLLLLKLYALPSLHRQGNFARASIYENDIATLIHYYQPQLEPLFAELASHLSETDLASVREIVADIQQRMARFRTGFAAPETPDDQSSS